MALLLSERRYSESLPIVHLPHLRFIISFEEVRFEAWTTFLGCISPKPGCSLSITIPDDTANPSEVVMLDISPVVLPSFKRFHRLSPPYWPKIQKARNRSRQERIQFFFRGFPKVPLSGFGQRLFQDHIFFTSGVLTFTVCSIRSVFSALRQQLLRATTEFHLVLVDCCFTRDPSDPQSVQFLSSFASVETLIVDESHETLVAL